MRIATLYDIHGNLPALEAVLADLQHEGVDQIVVGDDVLPEWNLQERPATAERKPARFWLRPVRLARPTRFAAHELTELQALVRDNEARFSEAWDEFFSS